MMALLIILWCFCPQVFLTTLNWLFFFRDLKKIEVMLIFKIYSFILCILNYTYFQFFYFWFTQLNDHSIWIHDNTRPAYLYLFNIARTVLTIVFCKLQMKKIKKPSESRVERVYAWRYLYKRCGYLWKQYRPSPKKNRKKHIWHFHWTTNKVVTAP